MNSTFFDTMGAVVGVARSNPLYYFVTSWIQPYRVEYLYTVQKIKHGGQENFSIEFGPQSSYFDLAMSENYRARDCLALVFTLSASLKPHSFSNVLTTTLAL